MGLKFDTEINYELTYKLCAKYCFLLQATKLRCPENVTCIGRREPMQSFGLETWRKIQLWIPRRRWEHNNLLDLQEVGCGLWAGSSRPRLGTGFGHLWMGFWNLVFYKMQGIFWLSESRLASQRLCSTEYVTYLAKAKIVGLCLKNFTYVFVIGQQLLNFQKSILCLRGSDA
jgi:hypothetical protein